MASIKSNLLILSIIVIILISGGFIIWNSFGPEIVDRFVPSPTPTPDPYAGWKTYTNEEYGFSIKYPNESTLDPIKREYTYETILFELSYTKEPNFVQYDFQEGMALSGSIITLSQTLTLEEFVNQDIETKSSVTVYSPGNHYTSVLDKNSFMIDDHPGISFQYKEYWQENDNGVFYLQRFKYFFKLDNNRILLFYTANASKDGDKTRINEYIRLSERIINSIQFYD